MEIIKEKTVAFTSCSIAEMLSGRNDRNLLNVISTELYLLVASFYKQGFRMFLSDMSDGFATLAAEAVRQFKYEKGDIQLVAVQSAPDMNLNDYLLANCSQMACYDDGRNDVFYHRAQKEGVPVINIFALLSDYFANDSPAKQALQPFDNIDGFRYCKEGILLCCLYGEKPIITPFENIGHVERRGDRLYVTLTNGLEADADILTE